ncbi:MAG TPA: hypothetical protein VMS17_19605 [Gemmataceae bacterium]|nr:hypothetical protein [Gemmataceae bacterium]
MMNSVKRIPRLLLAVVVTAVATAAAHADRLPRPGDDLTVLPAETTVTYRNQKFASGEPAVVTVMGDGSTVLELRIYDEFGVLVASDQGRTCRASWKPLWTGEFTIKVINRSETANLIYLKTN